MAPMLIHVEDVKVATAELGCHEKQVLLREDKVSAAEVPLEARESKVAMAIGRAHGLAERVAEKAR